jgi:hypothetical protein
LVFVVAGGRVAVFGVVAAGGRVLVGRGGVFVPGGRVGFVLGRVGRGRLLMMSKMSPGTLTDGRGRCGRCGRGRSGRRWRGLLAGGLPSVRGGVVGGVE